MERKDRSMNRIMECCFRFFFVLCLCLPVVVRAMDPTADCTLSNEQIRVCINTAGQIRQFSYLDGDRWENVLFALDNRRAGPSFWINDSALSHILKNDGKYGYEVRNDSLYFRIGYMVYKRQLQVSVTLKNLTNRTLKPNKVSLKMGVDACMEEYPQWNEQYFPTMLRCERTHFWGYLMNPNGKILAIGSPDSLTSWSIDYVSHHRLGSFNLDLLNAIPQPQRHPVKKVLLSGEEKTWRICLAPLSGMKEIRPCLSEICQAPIIDATGQYTITPQEKALFTVHSRKDATLYATSPDGTSYPLEKKGQHYIFVPYRNECGTYTVIATTGEKRSEARFYVRKPWSWYLEKARIATVEAPPIASCYSEWFYNMYTALGAARYLPDEKLDRITLEYWDAVLAQMYDSEQKKVLLTNPNHIQWYYTMIGMLTRSYQLSRKYEDLEMAADIADLLITRYQSADGAFRNLKGTHYTCVIYATKPLMELAMEEKKLSDAWRQRGLYHEEAARKATFDLLKRLDNIETEGEQTFEDGMISCSALQLGFMGLQTDDEALRMKYIEGTEYMLAKHRCLEALVVPDCRMIGGTFRFWEAYHDLRITPNMMNSPHGWSSWKTYATYYAYLLTGKEKWLRQTMDAVGSAMQMVDLGSGKLRWGFVPNPYIKARSLVKEDSLIIGNGTYADRMIGEEYLEMKRYWRKTQSSDNDVHEHFKMMIEVALSNAFVLKREDGEVLAYNCSVEKNGKHLVVTPYEGIVRSVHVNVLRKYQVSVNWIDKNREYEVSSGMTWLNK